ncbi:MAG: cysteine--tRNA ligase [Verrucomicrobiota bacterium]|jgi:cysteinyl-tRNA synthetase
MALKFFNTLSRSVQDFVPCDPGGRSVGLYCCGPTVHDFAHIGNFRTFVFADLLRRYLEFKGFGVRHVMNITDVEDKIIKRVRETKTPLRDYTQKYEAAFFEDFQALNCLPPRETPRASEHIREIIALIEKLVARGVAYRAADGSVYFSIQKYQESGHRYGQLLHLNFDRMRPGQRVIGDEYDKEAVADFALWKARVAEDGEVFWPSPWGEGRPGWHIECSAMSMAALGPGFDIHTGGEDLIFPHHEDEIAQSEGAAAPEEARPFVKYWMHGAHLLVEGKKMSKSLGNYFTLRDLLAKGFTGREIRYLLLTAHYRESFNFTIEGLQGARVALGRLDECLGKLHEIADDSSEVAPSRPAVLLKFEEAMDNDLNVAAAWGAIFEWVRDTNKELAENRLTPARAKTLIAAWQKINQVFGLQTKREMAVAEKLDESLQRLLDERASARKAKDFKRSDAIRDELKAKGWTVEDTPKGPRLKRL